MAIMNFHLLLVSVVSSLTLFLANTAQGAPGTLADEPLITSAGVAPNIMLFLDSSGSMRHVVVDAPYDPTVTYFNCPSSITLPVVLDKQAVLSAALILTKTIMLLCMRIRMRVGVSMLVVMETHFTAVIT